MGNLVNLINFSAVGDNRGCLVAIEAQKHVPFDIKRVYYVFDTRTDTSRGFHAHKALKQVAVCLSGSCRMLLEDGEATEEVILDSPTKGLVIDEMIWHEMHDFTEDCVMLVLASEQYDESDYIRDYDEFLEVAK